MLLVCLPWLPDKTAAKPPPRAALANCVHKLDTETRSWTPS